MAAPLLPHLPAYVVHRPHTYQGDAPSPAPPRQLWAARIPLTRLSPVPRSPDCACDTQKAWVCVSTQWLSTPGTSLCIRSHFHF